MVSIGSYVYNHILYIIHAYYTDKVNKYLKMWLICILMVSWWIEDLLGIIEVVT